MTNPEIIFPTDIETTRIELVKREAVSSIVNAEEPLPSADDDPEYRLAVDVAEKARLVEPEVVDAIVTQTILTVARNGLLDKSANEAVILRERVVDE